MSTKEGGRSAPEAETSRATHGSKGNHPITLVHAAPCSRAPVPRKALSVQTSPAPATKGQLRMQMKANAGPSHRCEMCSISSLNHSCK